MLAPSRPRPRQLLLPLADVTPPWSADRRECVGPRTPCAWIRCRFHLLSDVSENGTLSIAGETLALDASPSAVALFYEWAAELAATEPNPCAIHVAREQGALTDEEIGELMYVTRPRVWQIGRDGEERLGRVLRGNEELNNNENGRRENDKAERQIRMGVHYSSDGEEVAGEERKPEDVGQGVQVLRPNDGARRLG